MRPRCRPLGLQPVLETRLRTRRKCRSSSVTCTRSKASAIAALRRSGFAAMFHAVRAPYAVARKRERRLAEGQHSTWSATAWIRSIKSTRPCTGHRRGAQPRHRGGELIARAYCSQASGPLRDPAAGEARPKWCWYRPDSVGNYSSSGAGRSAAPSRLTRITSISVSMVFQSPRVPRSATRPPGRLATGRSGRSVCTRPSSATDRP